MPAEFASFAFIVTLAAVINGLGIVRWLTALADFLEHKGRMSIRYDWVFLAFALFQFLLHIFLWWSLWGVRSAAPLNFLTYLYMLAGPILMFLGSAFLAPRFTEESLDLRTHYYATRRIYANVLVLVWLWGTFASYVFRGHFIDSTAIYVVLIVVALAQRLTDSELVQRAAAIANWLLLAAIILGYGLELGGPAAIFD